MATYNVDKIWDKDFEELSINDLSKNMYILIKDKKSRNIDAIIVEGISPSIDEVDGEIITGALYSLIDVDVYNPSTNEWDNMGIMKEDDILSADFVDDGVILRFYEPMKNSDGSRNIVTTLNIEDSSSFDLLADPEGIYIASISVSTFSEILCEREKSDEVELELVPLSSMLEWLKRYKGSIMNII